MIYLNTKRIKRIPLKRNSLRNIFVGNLSKNLTRIYLLINLIKIKEILRISLAINVVKRVIMLIGVILNPIFVNKLTI
ncbi:hypothetical protein AQUCO_58800001v1 [Aquilegia coerulea]|uniref:Uncharacterized protein n=1 Tax=Aquilegia coerulea TaxID=218851 RepID=A0A2G5C0D5_AQUCA|nr:hypothetical protein AQUCO_58800001v1 [Aquilegia coerulea]